MGFYHQIFNRVFRKTSKNLQDSPLEPVHARKKVVSRNKKEHKLKIKIDPGKK